MRLCTILASLAFLAFQSLSSTARGGAADEYRITGPYTHENLSIYLIHGKDKLKGTNYLTLQEAMEKKVVIVHETGNVGNLSIENTGDVDIYIQSGDIVKGGKQDRTLALDLIVPAKSGKVPVRSFCVEQGRWQQRGGESLARFSSADGALASKRLKLAAKSSANQQEVWKEVENEQKKLMANTGRQVRSAESATSYQLTLEADAVRKSIDDYLNKLAPTPDGKDEVIGYAFAINGKINSADVYGSGALFKKLWPKLIKASAVEALGEIQKGKTYEAPSVVAVKECLAQAEQAPATEKDLSDRVKYRTAETEKSAYYETKDAARDGHYVHRNYVAK